MRQSTDETRVPVIVGVGQYNDRPSSGIEGMDPAGLMMEALERADIDGGGAWLQSIESLGVVGQIAFPGFQEIHHQLADRLGVKPRFIELTLPMGETPLRLINDAANRIAAGEITVAAAAGGEALRTAAIRSASGRLSNNLKDAVRLQGPSVASSYGLETPTEIYPLYENGCRAAWGQSLREAQIESAMIWSGLSRIAAANPDAWIQKPMTPEEILAETPDNRLIAFPYRKYMVANSAVNQGAAVIMTSLAEALRRGVPEYRVVYVGPGAAAHEPDDILARDSYHDSPGMRVSIERAMALNGLDVADLDCVELYSCFPCITKMARRVLGWPLDEPHSVYGGLTFGGGPIGNCMMHAAACMVQKLRQGASRGLIFANGGFATHNHTIILSRIPPGPGSFPQNYDYQADADSMRGPVPVFQERYTGRGTIETYTIIYDRRGEPLHGVVIIRAPGGTRSVCHVPGDDRTTIRFLESGETEPVGTEGVVTRMDDGRLSWTPHTS